MDGLRLEELFTRENGGLTYNDFILMPGFIESIFHLSVRGKVHCIERRKSFDAKNVDTRTRLSKRIELNVPFVSSPMDSVTGADMAIAMAVPFFSPE